MRSPMPRLLYTPWILLTWFLPVPDASAQMRPNGLPDIPIPPPAEAMPGVSVVSAQRARNYASPVQLYPGRSSIIDFAATGEVITYIQLSDLSDIVYDTNAPIDTGAARTVILRLIRPINIEGTTTATVPNIVVSTIDAEGNTYTYLFDLHQDTGRPSQNEGSGIAIAPIEDVREARLFNTVALQPNIIRTDVGNATLDDIERGLAIAIEAEYTPPDDPVVFTVEEAIALARNGTPLRTAAEELGLNMAILTSLGEIALKASLLDAVEESSDELSVPAVNQPSISSPEPIEIQVEVDELL